MTSKRAIAQLALLSIGFFFAVLLCNTICFTECKDRYPRQVYCLLTEYTTPGHTYCTVTVNNKQYKYLHHACDSQFNEWNPGTNAGTLSTVTRMGVCDIYSNYTYSIVPKESHVPLRDLCFNCNTNYFAFLYRMFIV